MDFQRGERVLLNFDDGEVKKLDHTTTPSVPSKTSTSAPPRSDVPSSAFPAFVSDVLERDAHSAGPPTAPSLRSGAGVNGFPAHRKRVGRVSAFKAQQQRESKKTAPSTSQTFQSDPNKTTSPSPLRPPHPFNIAAEKALIDRENRARLAAMSGREIEEEREELLRSLDPELVKKLLGRSDVREGGNEKDWEAEREGDRKEDGKGAVGEMGNMKSGERDGQVGKMVGSVESAREGDTDSKTAATYPHKYTTTAQPLQPNPPTLCDQIVPPNLPHTTVHFPSAPQPPDLDPSAPDFLDALHDKYFPNLPHDPSSLAWLRPPSPSDTTSPYHPSHTHLSPSDLRFDFTGALLPPSVAREIPVDRGLHHHAEAPEAAGYTIAELARLARSRVAAQRCVAFRTLGRVLYRLGKGEFGVEKASWRDGPVRVLRTPNVDVENGNELGEEDEDVGSTMAMGLWACIEEGRVLETLIEEAKRETGHLSARTYAQEALWNWRRGGGRKRVAV